MAAKKNIPELKVPENEDKELEQVSQQLQDEADAMAAKDAEIAALRKQLEEAQKTRAYTGGAGRESDYDRVQRAAEECAASGTDPWSVKIDIMVPHREKTEDPFYWINVNGQSVQIPANDRIQSVKLPWACVLEDYLRNEKMSADYQDSLEVFDPKDNPHRD